MTLSAARTAQSLPVQEAWTEKVTLKTWAASTVYRVGDIVRTAAESGNYYMCSVTGTSDSTAPTWLTTGATTTDNSVTWKYLGACYAGDIVQRPNGLAAYIVGLQSLPNQVMATFSYTGAIAIKSASTFTDGAAVFFNLATGYAVTAQPTYGYYVGTARGYWASSAGNVLAMINGAYSLLNSTAITFTGSTGANILTVPDNKASALYVKDASATIQGNICTTTGSESWLFSPGGVSGLLVNTVASGVTYVAITPAATGTGPTIAAAGENARDLNLKGTTTGSVMVTSPSTPYVATATGMTNTGYFKVFGKTAGGLTGGVKLTCADSMGYTLTLSAAAVGTADRTLTFPDPGGNDSVAYLALAQAITGAKTFTNAKVVVTQVTAVGSVASLATNTMAPGLNVIAGGGNNLGVMLPAASAGTVVEVVNASGSTALIYADGIGGTYAICINALATSTGYSLATTKTTKLVCENATRWWTIPLAVA